MVSSKNPPVVSWSAAIFIIILFFLTLFRLIFFESFKSGEDSLMNHMDAFILGFRYDLRTAAIIVLPVFLLSFLEINYGSYGSQNKLTAGSITRLIVAFISMLVVLLVLKNNKASWTTRIFSVIIFALIFFWVFRVKSCNPFKNTGSKKIWLTFF